MRQVCAMRTESVYVEDWLRMGSRRAVRRFSIRQSILRLRIIRQQVAIATESLARSCRASIKKTVRVVLSQSRLAEVVPDAMRRRCAIRSVQDKIRKDLQQ